MLLSPPVLGQGFRRAIFAGTCGSFPQRQLRGANYDSRIMGRIFSTVCHAQADAQNDTDVASFPNKHVDFSSSIEAWFASSTSRGFMCGSQHLRWCEETSSSHLESPGHRNKRILFHFVSFCFILFQRDLTRRRLILILFNMVIFIDDKASDLRVQFLR